MTQLSKATIYRMIKAGTFPRPIKIAQRAVGWRRGEVEEFLASRERAGSEFLSSDLGQ